MIRRHLDRLLERPWLYTLQAAVLAPGAERAIVSRIRQLLDLLPPAQHLLDVGCGPRSWLFHVGLQPLGVDVSLAYLSRYILSGAGALVGSAESLPVGSQRFDGVWSIGLLHHLPDAVAAAALSEMMRVCKPGGYVVVFDAVRPRHPWRRPLAHVIRCLDRGRYMREESALRRLLPHHIPWCCDRVTYTATGLEALICWSRLDLGAGYLRSNECRSSATRCR